MVFIRDEFIAQCNLLRTAGCDDNQNIPVCKYHASPLQNWTTVEVHFRDIIDIFTGWHRYGIMIKFKSVNIFSLKYEYEKSRAHKCSGR